MWGICGSRDGRRGLDGAVYLPRVIIRESGLVVPVGSGYELKR